MPTEISSGFPTADELTSDLNQGATSSVGDGTSSAVNTGSSVMPSVPGTSQGAAPEGAAGAGGGTVTQGAGDSEPMYEVVVGGKKWRVPVSELTKGYQRQRDYTQKTMELSEQRRAWEQERKQFEAQVEELQQWLSNPQNVYAYYNDLARRTGFNPAAPQNAAALQQLDLNKINQTIEQRMQQMQFKMQQDQLTNSYKSEIDTTIKNMLDTHPELRHVDDIDFLIRRDVANREPANLQEAKQLIAHFAQARAQRLQALKVEQAAQAAQQRSPLNNGIEPPGGTAPAPQAKHPNLKIGSPEFMQAVLSDMAAASVNNR